jgi:hypothetical protein
LHAPRPPKRLLVIPIVAAATVAGFVPYPGGSGSPARNVHPAGLSLTPMQWRLMSGTSQYALAALGVPSAYASTAPAAEPGGDNEGNGVAAGTRTAGAISSADGAAYPGPNGTCEQRFGPDVRVDTACTNYADPSLSGRSMAQNETAIAVNPTNPRDLVGSSNDYSRGDGNCGSYYSTNGGGTWSGTTAPMLFVAGSSLTPATPNARQYWQAGGDTEVAFNSEGTAFLQCQVFNRGAGTTQDPDVSSGVLFFRSANGGASWDFPGRVAASSYEPNGSYPNGVVLEDKPLFTIDNHVSSPYRDRIYMTWTSFTTDGAAYINETSSSDGGETWTPRKVISGDSSLCPVTYGVATPHGRCNENQFSDPFVGPDGNLYVVFDNYNNAVSGNDNWNQILLVKSTDGGATFSAPIQVGKYYDLPDCATYTGQDAGRACLPPTAFRATNYPSGAVNPTNPDQVVVNYGSFVNRYSNETTGCVPAGFSPATGANLFTGAATSACNNQILQSVSTNAGDSFTGTGTDPRTMPVAGRQRRLADEYWQWTGFTGRGQLVVGMYDRQYGNDATTGASDYSATVNGEPLIRETTASSPPPTEFGGLFNGDYNVLGTSANGAWVTWTDNRNPGLTSCGGDVNAICTLGQDEDDFAAPVPMGDHR